MRTSYLCSVIRKPSAHRFEDYIRFNKVKTKKMTEKNKLVETTNVVVNNVNNNDMKQEVAYKTVKANIAYSGGYPFSISGDIRSVPS